jgi:hypothetical protein
MGLDQEAVDQGLIRPSTVRRALYGSDRRDVPHVPRIVVLASDRLHAVLKDQAKRSGLSLTAYAESILAAHALREDKSGPDQSEAA